MMKGKTMLKIFIVYAVIAGIIITPWYVVSNLDLMREGVRDIARECKMSEGSVLVGLYVLLMIGGWLWLPFAIVRTIIKKVKGN